AKALNRPKEEQELYATRSLNYRHLYDKETKLMRPRLRSGEFIQQFNPLKWGDAFTEGNSWHYSWSVFQDVAGLRDLMGGNAAFVGMLDSVFSQPPHFDESGYGGVIHEIREMQIANMGQYAHGNQPIQHMIYLYNYGGQPWKAQYWVRESLNRLYKATPDGYCGDEDNGQTSAWYVFSAMGFYPVTPGTNQYVMGAPLFKKITVTLQNGKKLVINAPNNSDQNRYVQSVALNGKPWTKNWLPHDELQKGGVLNFVMASTPNMKRGIDEASAPYSFSKDDAAMYNRVKDRKPEAKLQTYTRPDTIAKDGLTLIFRDEESTISAALKQRLVDAYFMQYPKLISKYNSESPKKVTFFIDPTYNGVAEAGG
ncbi:MAG: glycoside hydrolase family 92 protein, partial [Chitinophagaceae bacterium]